MSRRFIYLVRHGQYQLYHRDAGMLTTKGLQQAQLTGQTLYGLPFSTIYHSPLVRAAQTAEIIAENLPDITVCVDESLRECIPSIPERYTDYFAGVHPDLTPDKVTDCADKLQSAFQLYFQQSYYPEADQYDLLICHGNVIRYMVARTLGLTIDGWASMLIHNCGITRIMIDSDQQLFLISHNDIGHLPEDLRTEN
ncbi:MAG: histidine phosphatase family protein [Anaerolineae bacterium]|jgi:broad specificity phosphatase PhoE|nr:histidine phosphatase family protein [Anaerolineae bacterium]